jgi:hypothetical protein
VPPPIKTQPAKKGGLQGHKKRKIKNALCQKSLFVLPFKLSIKAVKTFV